MRLWSTHGRSLSEPNHHRCAERLHERKLFTNLAMNLDKAIHLCKTTEQASLQIKGMTTKGTKTIDAVCPRTEQGKRTTDDKQTRKPSSEKQAKQTTPAESQVVKNCACVGSQHQKGNCPAYGKNCITCNKTGHVAAVCKTGKKEKKTERSSRSRTHQLK